MRTRRLAEIALGNVLQNTGAHTAGIDGVSKGDLASQKARNALIDEINRELCSKAYSPQAVRRVYIPKPNGDKRPLGIPTLKDRVVQEMLRLILEPIYEGKFHHHSYGFRPTRSTHHAVVRIHNLISRSGYDLVIEGDIRKCFDRIHHTPLLKLLRRTIKDERIIKIVRDLLKSGVMEDGAWHVTDEGAPRGGIVSPLLANVYLHELDCFVAAKWEWLTEAERNRHLYKGTGQPCFLVRYADDFVVLSKGTSENAVSLKAEIGAFLQEELGLELSEDKTLITPVDEGFDFLGFHIRRYRQCTTLVTPSQKAIQRFKRNVRSRVFEGFQSGNAAGIAHLNRYLTGWGNYYRWVSSKRIFRNLDDFVWHRVWKTTRRLNSETRKPKRAFFKTHYIPYRYSVVKRDRKSQSKNYGIWADAAHTKAYIVTKLSFIPIRYARFHSQQNPYLSTGTTTEKVADLPPRPNPVQEIREDEYGWEWPMVRRAVLERDNQRCRNCGAPVRGRQAQVHHRKKLRTLSRKKAHLLENLDTLCPACHKKADLAG